MDSATSDFSFGEYVTGDVNPNGGSDVSTYGWFEWGTDTSYGHSSPVQLLYYPPGATTVGISYDISALQPNTTYHVRAVGSNYIALGYSSDTSFTTYGPPVITSGPTNQAVAIGTPVTLSVSATSTLQPVSYQWQLNGSNIVSVTGSSYSIASAQVSDAGVYVAQVSNSFEGGYVVSSHPATLNVGAAPAPLLQFNGDGKLLSFSWPVYVPPYSLRTSTSVASTNWTNAGVALATNGQNVTASITESNVPQRYFRLQNP